VFSVNVAAMALVIAAAFGRSAFMNWLSRWQMSNVSTTNVTANAADMIRAYGDMRRDDERGEHPERDYGT
jgi:hypothetical protein